MNHFQKNLSGLFEQGRCHKPEKKKSNRLSEFPSAVYVLSAKHPKKMREMSD